MANLATKILLFFLIVAFTFNVTSGLKISCVGTGSVTPAETVDVVTDLEGIVKSITVNNLASIGITAVGLVMQNQFFIFAGLSTTFVNVLAFQVSIFNQNLYCLGDNFVSLISNIFNALLLFAVISWFGNKSGEAP